MGYQDQIDRAEATLGRIAATVERTEGLLAAVLDTLVTRAPAPRIQPPPSYTQGAHYAAAFPLVSNPQDAPGDVSLASLQGMIPADDPRSSIDPRYRFDGPMMGRAYTETAPPYQKDPPAYAWMNNPMLTASGPVMGAMPLPPARPAGSLHMIGPLADPIGTPGAVHPDYTEADIDKTIRVPGWTATVRPPTSYTTPLKLQMMREYGYPPDTDPASLELDHKVPLCVLGHPTSPLNLYPQPREGQWGARVKDICEVAAQHAVLNGHISLAEAQAGFMGSWVDLHIKLFSNPAIVASMMAMAMKPAEDEP